MLYIPPHSCPKSVFYWTAFQAKDNLNYLLITWPIKINLLPVQKGDFQPILDSNVFLNTKGDVATL